MLCSEGAIEMSNSSSGLSVSISTSGICPPLFASAKGSSISATAACPMAKPHHGLTSAPQAAGHDMSQKQSIGSSGWPNEMM